MSSPWAGLLSKLGRFRQRSLVSWAPKRSRRRGQHTGGGNTDMKPAKFLSRALEHPQVFKASSAARNQRRNRRQRLAA